MEEEGARGRGELRVSRDFGYVNQARQLADVKEMG